MLARLIRFAGFATAVAATPAASQTVDVRISGRIPPSCAATFEPTTSLVQSYCNSPAGYDLALGHMIVPEGVTFIWRGRGIAAGSDGETRLEGAPGPAHRTDQLAINWPSANEADVDALMHSLVLQINER